MKKILLFSFLLAALFAFRVSAQDKRTSVYGVERRTNSLEAGADYLIPAGDFGKVYNNNGFGADVRYRFAITEFKSLIVSVGYNSFTGKLALPGNNPVVDIGNKFIPIKVGMRFRFLQYVYISGEFGGTIALGVSNLNKINPYVAQEYQMKGFAFDFAPTFGFQIPTVKKNYVDLSIRYEGMSYQQSVKFFTGLRAAYAFDIPR